MDPVCFQEIDEEDDAAGGPGDRVGPGNCGEPVDEFYGDGYIGHPQDAPACQHNKHGNGCFAGTSQDRGNTMGKCQQRIEKADGPHMLCAKGGGCFRFAEKANELAREQVTEDPDHLRAGTAAQDSEGHAFFDPLMLSGAQILSHESGQRLGKAVDRQKNEALQLGVRAAACHSFLAEAVDICLNDHIGKGDHAELHARGKTVMDDLQKAFSVETDLSDADPIRRVDPKQMDKAQHRADTLSNGGGNGGGAYTPTKPRHKQHIQGNINNGGGDQVIQRMLAVAHGMEDSHKNVVHHCEYSAAEIKSEILDGLREHLLRRSHPFENGGSQCHTGNAQNDAGCQAEGDGGMDGLLHGVILLGAEGSGDDHTGAHGHAIEEAGHHPNKASGGTDRCQCVFTDKIAYTPRVKGIIELLENVTDEYRQSKQEHGLPDRTFR